MRGVMLKDLSWEAHIEYENFEDSRLLFSVVDAPTMLEAVAHVYKHCRECWPFEIISITQKTAQTTNDERPFERGDLIKYAGDKFTVLENQGDRGKVQEYPGGCIVDPFYWDYEGEKCRRVE